MAPFRWGGLTATAVTAQHHDAVLKLASPAGLVVADLTRTTACISEESILHAHVAERQLDRKRAKDIFPMQFGTQILRQDGGQAVGSCTNSADGSCH